MASAGQSMADARGREELMDKLDPEQFSGQLQQLGVPAQLAKETMRHVDPRMKDCILRLYRSAINVGREWEPDLVNIRAPGLVLWGAQDEACPVAFAGRLAEATCARRVVTFQTGHWFLLQAPVETAQALEEHWQSAAS